MSNNNKNYSNVFKDVANSVKGTPMSALALVLALAALGVGINYYAEDLYSSRMGMFLIEQNFNMTLSSWDGTYWAGSAALQVISMLCFLTYLSNTRKYLGALFISFSVQAIDVGFDMWYRSGMSMFDSPKNFFVTFLYTFIVTTLLSELLLSFGFGFTKVLLEDGSKELGNFFRAVVKGFINFFFGDTTKPRQQQRKPVSHQKNGINSRKPVTNHRNSGARGRKPPQRPPQVNSREEELEKLIRAMKQ